MALVRCASQLGRSPATLGHPSRQAQSEFGLGYAHSIHLHIITMLRGILAVNLFVVLIRSVVHRSQSLGHTHWLHDVVALQEDLVDLFEMPPNGLWEE